MTNPARIFQTCCNVFLLKSTEENLNRKRRINFCEFRLVKRGRIVFLPILAHLVDPDLQVPIF